MTSSFFLIWLIQHYYLFAIDVTIGFTPMAYQVNEADGRVELNVSMTTGISQRAVSLLFTLTNGTAFCK